MVGFYFMPRMIRDKLYSEFLKTDEWYRLPPFELRAALDKMGSLPSFAAQCTNGRNAENQPFAAHVSDVSVADLV